MPDIGIAMRLRSNLLGLGFLLYAGQKSSATNHPGASSYGRLVPHVMPRSNGWKTPKFRQVPMLGLELPAPGTRIRTRSRGLLGVVMPYEEEYCQEGVVPVFVHETGVTHQLADDEFELFVPVHADAR